MTNLQIKELKTTNQILALVVVLLAITLGIVVGKQKAWIKNQPSEPVPQREIGPGTVPLQPSKVDLAKPLNQIIQSRRSNQQIIQKPLVLDQLASLIWSMQGITASWGERAVPTIRGAFPLTVSVIVRNVEGIEPGLYVYDPEEASLKMVNGFDTVLAETTFKSNLSLSHAPVVVGISGSKIKLKNKMDGQEHLELLYLEAGHATQNGTLEAESIGLSVSPATLVENANAVFKTTSDEVMLSLFAVGYPKAE
jgi:hypothetical protein